MDEAFTTFKASKILDIKYGRLREWIDREYIPFLKRAEGAGDKTLFDRLHLCIIALFVYLLDRGMKREEAAERVKGVDQYLRVTKIFDQPDMFDFIGIVNRPRVERKPSKSVLKLIKDISERPGPTVRIISHTEYTTKSLAELAGGDFDDMVIVNFGKIRQSVEERI